MPSVGLGKPVGLVALEVDPLDVVGVAATRRHHVHRRHRPPPNLLVTGHQSDSTPPTTSDKAQRTRPRCNRRNFMDSISILGGYELHFRDYFSVFLTQLPVYS